MFKYHKFCVVDVAGLLLGRDLPDGGLALELIDGVEPLGSSPSRPAPSVSPPLALSEAPLRIADAGLIRYLREQATRSADPDYPYRLRARLTGSVGIEGGSLGLSDITQAEMNDGVKPLHYVSGH